ncbi:hypothetical protein [Bradyrhizobium sp. UFLA03-84]|uniref:hypothetical protein n=1 Tax=Bradyrhizobium sp. UFLA03-84 TaxID=418599 RepID=UPI001177802F|nr:hypothetical protein [Bradyrhizobium sp. UFLA03-84]
MSFQLTVLKVLAGQTAGRSSVAQIRQAVEILMNSGKDWTDRMKRLAEHAPGLNIFSAKYVLRDEEGWEITVEGRQFLAVLETTVAAQTVPRAGSDDLACDTKVAQLATITGRSPDLARRRRDSPRRRRRKDRPNRRTA